MSKFKKLISGNQPVLVDFFATWCGPCQTMKPVLDEVKRDLGNSVRIVKVDVDKNPGAAQQFGIRGVPTFILFKNGQPVWRKSGVVPKNQLKKVIEQKG